MLHLKNFFSCVLSLLFKYSCAYLWKACCAWLILNNQTLEYSVLRISRLQYFAGKLNTGTKPRKLKTAVNYVFALNVKTE